MKRSILPCPCACKAQKTKTSKTTTTNRKAAVHKATSGAMPKQSGYTVETRYERQHHPAELRRLSFRLVDAQGLACSEWMQFPWCTVDMVDAISMGLKKGFLPILNGWISDAIPACIQVVPAYLSPYFAKR